VSARIPRHNVAPAKPCIIERSRCVSCMLPGRAVPQIAAVHPPPSKKPPRRRDAFSWCESGRQALGLDLEVIQVRLLPPGQIHVVSAAAFASWPHNPIRNYSDKSTAGYGGREYLPPAGTYVRSILREICAAIKTEGRLPAAVGERAQMNP